MGVQVLKNKKNKTGFTLVELMIVVTIIGLLAAVAIPAYKKYIQKSKSAEAGPLLRKAYDAEVLWHADPKINQEGTTCGNSISPVFSPISTFQTPTKACLSTGLSDYLPSMKKSFLCSFSLKRTALYTSGCTLHASYATVGTEVAIFEGAKDYPSDASFSTGTVNESPGYFLLRAATSANMATEYSVAQTSTMLIQAFADLDGDHSGFVPYSLASMPDPSTESKLWVISRGIYIDGNGDVQGTAGLYQSNPGE